MPDLDITDLLTDPDLTDTFTVIRRLQVVNGFGEVTVTPTTFTNLRGAVFPAGDNSLARQDAFQTQSKSITVATQFRLRGISQDKTGAQYQPDIVVWNGDNYEVRSLSDFSNYGAGFTQADCVSVDLLDLPPT